MSKIKLTCDCGNEYFAREADLKRGWGKSCSKSCAAKKRERKTGNFKRYINWHQVSHNSDFDCYVGGCDQDLR